MNELRWILLAAGVILIAALYFWGMRSRWAGRGDAEPLPKAAVFPAASRRSAQPMADDSVDEAEDDSPVALRAEPRRIEPSLGDEGLDGDIGDDDLATAPRRASILDDEAELERPAVARREPTLSAARAEPLGVPPRQEPTLQAEPAAGRRIEPTVVAPPPEPPKRPAQKIIAIRVTATAPARFSGADLLGALQAEGLSFGRYDIFHCFHDDGRPIYSVASLKEPGTFDLAAMPETQYPGVAVFAVLPGPVPAAEAFDEMIFSARALATHLNGVLADERGAPLNALRVGKLREDALDFERSFGPA